MITNKSNFLATSIAATLISLSYSANSIAEINTEGGVFLYGNNIQVGINKHGVFGSDARSRKKPYDIDSNEIGFISDPSGNNFTGKFDGDFFIPGTKEAGWGVRFNDTDYHNTRNYQQSIDNKILGNFGEFKDLATTQEIVWKGTIENKLEIRQNFSIYKKGLTAIVDIELTNLTNATMNNVYYMQTVDPDNNYQTNGNFSTLNKVVSQGDTDGVAIISATQKRQGGEETGYSEVKLIGYTKNARVAYGGKANRKPVDIYTGTDVLKTTGEETADESISLAVKYDNIAAGETVKFKIALQLINSAIPKLTLDTDKSSNAKVNNGYKTHYLVKKSAIPVVDTDLQITQETTSNLMGAEIILATPHSDDVIKVALGNLPEGISIDTQRSTDSKLVLTGGASVEDYKTALKAVRYENTSATPDLDERIINILILDKVYTLSNAAQAFIGVVVPVTIQGNIATDDIVNRAEQKAVKPSGTATPNLNVALVFTDKNNKTVTATTLTNAQGVWNSDAVDISTLAEGEISLSAKTTDAKAYTSIATKSFQKDTQIDSIVITTPTLNQVIAEKEATISGTADPESAIKVQIDANNHCSAIASAEGDWSCKVDKLILDKTYPLEVTSTDHADNESKVSSSFKTPPLTLVITAPKNKSTVTGRAPLIVGTSLPKTKITVTAGDKSCSAITSATGEWSCTIADLPIGGPQLLSVKAEGVDGVTIKTEQLEITVPDKPLVVTSPQQNALIEAATIEVAGTTDPKAKIKVSTGVTGESCSVMADNKGDWSCSFQIKQADETKTLTITSELTGVDKKTATVITKHPSILEVTNPKDKTTVASSSPLMTGKSVANAVITATVGNKSCTAIASETGDWRCTLKDLSVGGPQKLVVSAKTTDGLIKSTELDISVPEKPLVVTSPKQNELILSETITTTGTTEPHALVTVSTGETGEFCRVDADAKGDWNCEFPIKKMDETKTLTIISELTGVDKKTATLNIKLPSLLEVTTPEDNSTVAGTSALITGKSVPNSTIIATVGDKSCSAITSATGDWHCTIKDLPIGGPHKLVIEAKTTSGLKKLAELAISVPAKPLLIASPPQDELISGTTIAVKGTTDPLAKVTVKTGIALETCTTVADSQGNWQCDFEVAEFSETKSLMIGSSLKGSDEKVATVNIKLEATGEKEKNEVTTVLKGSGGSSSPFVLLLMALNILLMRRFFKK